MRYKIKTRDLDSLRRVEALTRKATRVYLVSSRRLMLSTDEIPDHLRHRIEELGGTITPEHRYDLEAAKQA